jgi:hypothetical protein
MIFDLHDLEVDIVHQFDGEYNYFNPTYWGGLGLLRRESKFEDTMLVSDIVTFDQEVILRHQVVDGYLISYEDARLFSKSEIGVCVCRRKLDDLPNIDVVSYQKYNLDTKEFTEFTTQNDHFEKHWQFYNGRIIYHVDPYTILGADESPQLKRELNWSRWKDSYGNPGLSTNVFTIHGKNYLLFHSYIVTGKSQFKYYVGLLYLDSNLNPIAYTHDPLFESNILYSDLDLLDRLWTWRKTKLQEVFRYEVIFPMTVDVMREEIDVWCGLNDCSAVNIHIPTNEFVNKIDDALVVLL